MNKSFKQQTAKDQVSCFMERAKKEFSCKNTNNESCTENQREDIEQFMLETNQKLYSSPEDIILSINNDKIILKCISKNINYGAFIFKSYDVATYISVKHDNLTISTKESYNVECLKNKLLKYTQENKKRKKISNKYEEELIPLINSCEHENETLIDRLNPFKTTVCGIMRKKMRELWWESVMNSQIDLKDIDHKLDNLYKYY